MPGCSASQSFSNCARVITVLQAVPVCVGSAQKPFTVITGSSGPTFTSGTLSAAGAAGWRRTLPAGQAGEQETYETYKTWETHGSVSPVPMLTGK